MNEALKKIKALAEIFLYTVGVIGGFGYACYLNAYFIASCIVALGAMAFPEFKNAWKELNG